MFDFIKKNEEEKNRIKSHEPVTLNEERQEIRTELSHGISSKSKHKSISKSIKRQRMQLELEKLRTDLEIKIERAKQKFNDIILENSESEQSERASFMDEWSEEKPKVVILKNSKLERIERMAPKKYTVAKRKPNELTDEELPE